MTRNKIKVEAEVIRPLEQYEIDWQRISEQVQQAAEMVLKGEPDMKKKNGKKKKGY